VSSIARFFPPCPSLFGDGVRPPCRPRTPGPQRAVTPDATLRRRGYIHPRLDRKPSQPRIRAVPDTEGGVLAEALSDFGLRVPEPAATRVTPPGGAGRVLTTRHPPARVLVICSGNLYPSPVRKRPCYTAGAHAPKRVRAGRGMGRRESAGFAGFGACLVCSPASHPAPVYRRRGRRGVDLTQPSFPAPRSAPDCRPRLPTPSSS